MRKKNLKSDIEKMALDYYKARQKRREQNFLSFLNIFANAPDGEEIDIMNIEEHDYMKIEFNSSLCFGINENEKMKLNQMEKKMQALQCTTKVKCGFKTARKALSSRPNQPRSSQASTNLKYVSPLAKILNSSKVPICDIFSSGTKSGKKSKNQKYLQLPAYDPPIQKTIFDLKDKSPNDLAEIKARSQKQKVNSPTKQLCSQPCSMNLVDYNLVQEVSPHSKTLPINLNTSESFDNENDVFVLEGRNKSSNKSKCAKSDKLMTIANEKTPNKLLNKSKSDKLGSLAWEETCIKLWDKRKSAKSDKLMPPNDLAEIKERSQKQQVNNLTMELRSRSGSVNLVDCNLVQEVSPHSKTLPLHLNTSENFENENEITSPAYEINAFVFEGRNKSSNKNNHAKSDKLVTPANKKRFSKLSNKSKSDKLSSTAYVETCNKLLNKSKCAKSDKCAPPFYEKSCSKLSNKCMRLKSAKLSVHKKHTKSAAIYKKKEKVKSGLRNPKWIRSKQFSIAKKERVSTLSSDFSCNSRLSTLRSWKDMNKSTSIKTVTLFSVDNVSDDDNTLTEKAVKKKSRNFQMFEKDIISVENNDDVSCSMKSGNQYSRSRKTSFPSVSPKISSHHNKSKNMYRILSPTSQEQHFMPPYKKNSIDNINTHIGESPMRDTPSHLNVSQKSNLAHRNNTSSIQQDHFTLRKSLGSNIKNAVSVTTQVPKQQKLKTKHVPFKMELRKHILDESGTAESKKAVLLTEELKKVPIYLEKNKSKDKNTNTSASCLLRSGSEKVKNLKISNATLLDTKCPQVPLLGDAKNVSTKIKLRSNTDILTPLKGNSEDALKVARSIRDKETGSHQRIRVKQTVPKLSLDLRSHRKSLFANNTFWDILSSTSICLRNGKILTMVSQTQRSKAHNLSLPNRSLRKLNSEPIDILTSKPVEMPSQQCGISSRCFNSCVWQSNQQTVQTRKSLKISSVNSPSENTMHKVLMKKQSYSNAIMNSRKQFPNEKSFNPSEVCTSASELDYFAEIKADLRSNRRTLNEIAGKILRFPASENDVSNAGCTYDNITNDTVTHTKSLSLNDNCFQKSVQGLSSEHRRSSSLHKNQLSDTVPICDLTSNSIDNYNSKEICTNTPNCRKSLFNHSIVPICDLTSNSINNYSSKEICTNTSICRKSLFNHSIAISPISGNSTSIKTTQNCILGIPGSEGKVRSKQIFKLDSFSAKKNSGTFYSFSASCMQENSTSTPKISASTKRELRLPKKEQFLDSITEKENNHAPELSMELCKSNVGTPMCMNSFNDNKKRRSQGGNHINTPKRIKMCDSPKIMDLTVPIDDLCM